MNPTAYLDDIPRPVWIAAMVVGFIWFWPVGLAVLAYMIGARRFRRNWACAPGRWYNAPNGNGQQGSGQTWGQNWAPWGPRRTDPPPSGNAAFDEYRAETLRRLEDEQREFVEYLERLRRAKDKAEFDQFMADRRRPPAPPADINPA